MNIQGFQKFSLSDFPGRASAIVFTQGCNFRCPWCHNRQLIPEICPASARFTEDDILGFLEARRGRLDGLVITGGEPTIQEGLQEFAVRVRELGFQVKLDTNGSMPRVLSRLIAGGLVDYLAIDIKAPPDKYDLLTGIRAPMESVIESISLAARSGIEHEFRTTWIPDLLSPPDMERISALVPSGSKHTIQIYRQPPLYAADTFTGAA